MYKIVAEKYPNNEVRLTSSVVGGRFLVGVEKEKSGGAIPSVTARAAERSGGSSSLPPLDISSELETGGEMPFQRTKFGLNARRKLLRAGGALDRYDSNPQNYVFLTGTLPGSTENAKRAIAIESSWLVHRLKAWVNKRVPGKLDMYVWELQKRGALHLHYVVYCNENSVKTRLIKEFKAEWIRLIDELSQRTGIDCYETTKGFSWRNFKSVTQARAEIVRKSVCAYLAGYCSAHRSKHSLDGTSPYYPRRWWGISRPLNALLASMSSRKEFLVASFKEMQRLHEELAARLHAFTVKGYDYRHKVGVGKTSIAYSIPDELENVWSFVVEDRQMNSVYSHSVIRRQMLHLLQQYFELCQMLSTQKSLPKRLDVKQSLEILGTSEQLKSLPSKTLALKVEYLGSCLPLQSLQGRMLQSKFAELVMSVKAFWKWHYSVQWGRTGEPANEEFLVRLLTGPEKADITRTSSERNGTPLAGLSTGLTPSDSESCLPDFRQGEFFE